MKIEAGFVDSIVSGAKGLASNIVASDIKGITMSSAYTAPITYTGQQLVQMANGPMDPNAPSTLMGKILKPTISIDSSVAGRYTIAPYGSALPDEYRRNQIALGVIVGASALLFWAIGFKMGRGIGK